MLYLICDKVKQNNIKSDIIQEGLCRLHRLAPIIKKKKRVNLENLDM